MDQKFRHEKKIDLLSHILQRSVVYRYGGHQYGLWVGQLGDGRAHILGEYVNG
jgi:uncharacterized protein YdiU (UPF0061 family)